MLLEGMVKPQGWVKRYFTKFKPDLAPSAVLGTPGDFTHPRAALAQTCTTHPTQMNSLKRQFSMVSVLEKSSSKSKKTPKNNQTKNPTQQQQKNKPAKVQHRMKSGRRRCQGDRTAAVLFGSSNPEWWQLLLWA